MYMGQEVVELLVSQGSQFVNRLAKGESWCLLVQKGVGVLHEVLTTVQSSVGGDGDNDAAPTSLLLVVPLKQGMRTNSVVYEVEYEMKEVIPVAIVTARRLPHVLRQVGQVWASPGGTNTPITIFVDGHNPEAQALAALLHLPLVQHHNPASKGSSTRINEHIKFALKTVFEIYNTANLSIILEDDLQLAPDFIPYFHQTAPLLKSDPYLLFVNAFNYNSYDHTAYDPRRLYRAHGIPGYGWMTTRQGAADMLANWVPNTKRDAVWDWWVRARVMGSRDMLLPEVPRTRHMGGGGTHVSGFDQLFYSSQPLNNLTSVTLDVERGKEAVMKGSDDIHGLDSAEEANYEYHILQEMRSAQVVTLTQHPCEVTPLPTHQVHHHYSGNVKPNC
ncbi:protein O-linked-mannose beta-1,2-N-acetylglucosaminyltransferase 1-like [Procambarus clarkii]|uniref:protein O-linked-mannose beta-1,2-N-acetylglucosaminyltransferase 1-like n=1 Tax=Procambarus clarkii TaxID=6728 RepID=UPI00374410AE